MTDARLLLGDCIEVMADLDENSIDAIVCDPPYGLEFMGKEWDKFRIDPRAARWSGEASGGAGAGFGELDGGTRLPTFGKRRTTGLCRNCGKRDAFRNPHACGDAADWVLIPVDNTPMEMRAFQNWCALWAVEALRVLKPGGHLLAFGGTRTHHRLTCALEEAGFEIRDELDWIYGSGFPKSLDVSKAIDAAEGVERERQEPRHLARPSISLSESGFNVDGWAPQVSEPVTDLAKQWEGWGTGLKPAREPVVLARKLLVERSVAGNVLAHGTGALNVGASEIGTDAGWSYPNGPRGNTGNGGAFDGKGLGRREEPVAADGGRWPANVLLSHLPDCKGSGPHHTDVLCAPGCPVAELNEMSGETASARSELTSTPGTIYGGGAGLPSHTGVYGFDDAGGAARFFYISKPRKRERIGGTTRNLHPTVKPVDLMRYLVRLVTPPGGVVLDPFLGSGSTGCAAMAEGFRFVGIELDAESFATARERISDWAFAHGRERPAVDEAGARPRG